MSFVHLNLHTEYSVIDSIVKINDLAAKAKLLKFSAIAITDWSNIFAIVKFYDALKKAGVKPILGAHIIINDKYESEIILLCKNETGYKNLIKIVSQAYTEGHVEDKVLVDKDFLAEHNAGLIAIFSFYKNGISIELDKENHTVAESLQEYWSGIFANRLYLEVYKIDKPKENELILKVLNFASKVELPVVATNAVRFLQEEDYSAHEARVCINKGEKLTDTQRHSDYTKEQYLKSSEQMQTIFAEFPELISNSVEISKMCNVHLELGKAFFPNYPTPNNTSLDEFFQNEVKRGLQYRLDSVSKSEAESLKPKYDARIEEEIGIICKMGFAGYFLIVADFIKWAKKHNIPVGPGRGSGAGSLVAYALEITNICPLKYELLFERFLNPERVSMPDFDIDFCIEGRDLVIQYVAQKYGKESVSQIITYGTMAAKAVVRDVGRVLNHAYGFVDSIAKLIPNEVGITLKKSLEEPGLSSLYKSNDDVKTIIDMALKLEGITRNVGKHAGGVVIAPSKLTDFTAIYTESNDSSLVAQFDKNDVESVGLVKFDFLGLRTLTIIASALSLINLKLPEDAKINIDNIDLKCDKTFKLLQECRTTGVFQLESWGMKDLVRRLKPSELEDIIALVALFRPGPLQSGMVDDFINRKHKRAEISYLHPKLESILAGTYGVILYQEQVMQIAQVLANYTLGAADLLRRAMGKKKPEEMEKQRSIFLAGTKENNIDASLANNIFDLMEKFAGYGFNKSHSAAYGLITYQTAWLKAHYPAEFIAACLSADMGNTPKIMLLLAECEQIGITVLNPDINVSEYKFTVNNEGQIVYGLGAIKGVGQNAINSVMITRQHEKFTDIFDFCSRIDLQKVSKKVLEVLVKAGAFDNIDDNRARIFSLLPSAVSAAETFKSNKKYGQIDLFNTSIKQQDLYEPENSDKLIAWDKLELLSYEKETLGLYLSGHPLESYTSLLSSLGVTPISKLSISKNILTAGLVNNVRTVKTKRNDRMSIVTLDAHNYRQEIVLFSDAYQSFKEKIIKDEVVVINCDINKDNHSGGLKLVTKKVMSIDEVISDKVQGLELHVNYQDFNSDTVKQIQNIILECESGDVKIILKVKYKDALVKYEIMHGKSYMITKDTLRKISKIYGLEYRLTT